MTDDLENLLQSFRPAGPPAHLREKILSHSATATATHSPPRPWPLYLFRSALAALLLLSFALLHAANTLNQNSAAQVGIGPPRWTPEAQQAADLLGNTPAARQYIALCLLAANAPQSRNASTQGVPQ